MRKKFPFSRFAVVAVLALAGASVAIAQSDMGNLTPTGATYAVGVVESLGSEYVTIVLASGERQTILLGDHTVGKSLLANGFRARIDYRVDERGQAVAEVIQSGGEEPATVAAAEPAVRTWVEPSEAAAVEPSEAAAVEPAPVEAAAPETPMAMPEASSETLPATASTLPGLALLGLLSFVGAVALRFAR